MLGEMAVYLYAANTVEIDMIPYEALAGIVSAGVLLAIVLLVEFYFRCIRHGARGYVLLSSTRGDAG